MDETVKGIPLPPSLESSSILECREAVANYIEVLVHQLRIGNINGLKVEWHADAPTIVDAVVCPRFPIQYLRLSVMVDL